MLKNIFGIKYFLALAFLLVPIVIPIKAWGGVEVVNTDNEGHQLYYFWDLRNRETFFQVTNASSNPIQVHVQVFNAATANCDEFDFFDTYSPNGTHLYNVRKLDSNDGKLIGPPTLDNGFGFITVTLVEQAPDTTETSFLIGNFRIIDKSGYEYRTNAANLDGNDFIPGFHQFTFNFNDVGSTASDVVGIVAVDSGEFGGPERENSVDARPDLSVTLTPTLYDDKENPISCPPVTFACGTANSAAVFDTGINEAIPNSKDGSHICLGTATRGFVALSNYHDNFVHTSKTEHHLEGHFIGFIGLNNGGGRGTMDSFWSVSGSKTSEGTVVTPAEQLQ